MIRGKFRPYETEDVHDVSMFVELGGFTIPSDEIYVEIRKFKSNYGDQPFIIGSFTKEAARNLGEALIEFANKRTVVVTDRDGRVHSFPDPRNVEDK